MSLGVVIVKKSELASESGSVWCYLSTLSLSRQMCQRTGCLSQKTPRWDAMVGLWFYSGVDSLQRKIFLMTECEPLTPHPLATRNTTKRAATIINPR
jgi:hypothetical protein